MLKESPLHFQVKYSGGDASEPVAGGQPIPRSVSVLVYQCDVHLWTKLPWEK